MRKLFCYCKCYYERNLYLKEYETHFMYKNRSQLLADYSEVFDCYDGNEVDQIEKKLKSEIEERKKRVSETVPRKKRIQENYVPLHPDIFKLSSSILDPSFLELCDSFRHTPKPVKNSLKHVKNHRGRIFTFPVFSLPFCDKLVEELKHFENSPLPKQRPNTMNKYGVNVDELGFEALITELREDYLRPLTSLLFPDWGGSDLDSHKAFVVAYKMGEDVDLGCHFDNAEVTLNVSLNDSFSEGDLFFGPMRSETTSFQTGLEHRKGRGILHRGQQMHGAFPIGEGERYNLIIWMRSSTLRNERCPMCDLTPEMEPVEEGTGDGFTITVDDICVTS